MYWIDEVVENLIKDNPSKESFVCASGISPSGSIHLGNFREFITSYFVAEGLKKAGKKVRFFLSFDNYDRLRKIPQNVRAVVGDTYDKYIGMPYDEVPDPFGCHESYGKHFEDEFKKSILQFGIDPEYIYQADEYKRGRYKDEVIRAVAHRGEIYDILFEYKSQEATDEGREKYVPLNIYCDKCKHDSTTITHVSENNSEITYTCKCGREHTIDLNKYFNVKLPWKVDWPMRWKAEDVDFEPGGKDHGTQGSSYTVGKIISKQIYGKTAPSFVMYEFVGIKGGAGKMGSSSGLVFTPGEVLKVYPPEMILWLFSRVDSRQSWSFCFDEEILRQYHEFDRMWQAYQKEDCPENIKNIMYYALITTKRKEPNNVNAALLASLAPITNFNKELTYKLFKKIDPNVNRIDLEERLTKIEYWMKTYSKESIVKLLKEKNTEYFSSLTADEQKEIKNLFGALSGKTHTLEELQQLLYDIPKRQNLDQKQNMPHQKKFFENVYMLLTGKSSGPRLYLYLGALEKEEYLPLLNF